MTQKVEHIYQNIQKNIYELITLAEKQQDKYHLVAIFDTPGDLDALSGVIYPVEHENIETGFVCSTKYYTGYRNSFNFIKDLYSGKFQPNENKIYLIYNTSQLGTGINRRLFIPIFCDHMQLLLLTCDAYLLGLLQNKAHYFYLLDSFFKIPQTYVYSGELDPQFNIKATDVILKPALECAALGVRKMENNKNEIIQTLEKMRQRFQQDILVQEYIDGYEVSVPVINKGTQYIALPPVWIQFENSILTFDLVDKIQYSMHILPQEDFPLNSLIPELLSTSEHIMKFLGTKGITRVDFRITKEGGIYIIDLAALPVLAHTGTCQKSFSALFPDKKFSIFQALIGSALFNLPNS